MPPKPSITNGHRQKKKNYKQGNGEMEIIRSSLEIRQERKRKRECVCERGRSERFGKRGGFFFFSLMKYKRK